MSYLHLQVDQYCTEYRNVLNRATSLGYEVPSKGMQFLQDRVVRKLIKFNLWNKLDLFYIFRNDVPSSKFWTLNFKNPHRFQWNPNALVTNADRLGLYGHSYQDTLLGCTNGWIPASDAVALTLNNGGHVFGCTAYPFSGFTVWTETPTNRFQAYYLDRFMVIALNSTGISTTVGEINAIGHYNFVRNSATNLQIYRNNTSLHSSAVTAAGLSNQPLDMDYHNAADVYPGSRISFTNPIGYWGVGSFITTATDYPNFQAVMTEYEDAIIYNAIMFAGTSYTVPANISGNVLVECMGAGGAGGGTGGATSCPGGGGGAYSASVVSVTPSQVIPVAIGVGGVGVAGTGPAGGDTSWNSGVVLAKGGGGGGPLAANPGAGGQASAGTGDVKFSGGQGGAGFSSAAGSTGCGGSAASSIMDGPPGQVGVSASVARRSQCAPLGGGAPASSRGSADNSNGNPGTAGSGGGGARRTSGTRLGGNGGAGFIRVSQFKDTSIYG